MKQRIAIHKWKGLQITALRHHNKRWLKNNFPNQTTGIKTIIVVVICKQHMKLMWII